MLSLIAFILFLSLSLIGSNVSWAGPPLQEGGVKQLIPASNWQKQFKITDGKELDSNYLRAATLSYMNRRCRLYRAT